MGGPIRVYLLDDHEVVRRGLADLFDTQPDLEVVGQTARADLAVDEIVELRPDVAVLDARLPTGSGTEVCRRVREACVDGPRVQVLLLTSSEDSETVATAVESGVDGYVLKSTRLSLLLDAVRRVASGERHLDPAITPQVFDLLRQPGQPGEGASGQQESSGSTNGATIPKLSAPEMQLLRLLGQGMTNREIAGELFLAEKTVRNYVSRLLSRLGVNNRTEAAVLATRLPATAASGREQRHS